MIDEREYGLTSEHRRYVIEQKFGSYQINEIELLLSEVKNQTDRVLGAILFLVRENDLSNIKYWIELANNDEKKLLTAATVKHERVTGKLKF